MSKKINGETLKLWGIYEEDIVKFINIFPNGASLQEVYYGLNATNNYYLIQRICALCSGSSDKQYYSQTISIGGFKEKNLAFAHGVAITGEEGESIAGEYGTAISGFQGIALAGFMGTAIVKEFGLAIAGICGTAKSGDFGVAKVGENGQAIASGYGIAIAGKEGIAIVNRGHSFAGEKGTAIADKYGTVSAGIKGKIIFRTNEFEENYCRIGFIGKNGLKPNTSYVFDNEDNFVESQISDLNVEINWTDEEFLSWARNRSKRSDLE